MVVMTQAYSLRICALTWLAGALKLVLIYVTRALAALQFGNGLINLMSG